MKKLIAFVLALACVLSIAGCSPTADKNPTQTSTQASTQTPTKSNQSNQEPNHWGLVLTADNVTANSLTIVCTHTGGENVANLFTGSYYTIQRLDKTHWVDVEYAAWVGSEHSWTDIAWIIEKESTTKWDVNWEFLYGTLPAGEYRMGKEIMNLRGPGDFDEEMVYLYFAIL